MIKNLEMLSFAALILVLIGAIDLGLYGLFGVDILGKILGVFLSRLLDFIIGLAGGYLIYLKFIKKTG